MVEFSYHLPGMNIRKKIYVKAYVWYVLSVQADESLGKDYPERVRAKYLTSETFAAAQEAIRAWRPGQCEVDLGVNEIDAN